MEKINKSETSQNELNLLIDELGKDKKSTKLQVTHSLKWFHPIIAIVVGLLLIALTVTSYFSYFKIQSLWADNPVKTAACESVSFVCYKFDLDKEFNKKIDQFYNYKEEKQLYARWGAFGDYIGGLLNPILSFLALIALWYTVKLQSKELSIYRDEIKTNRRLLKIQVLISKESTQLYREELRGNQHESRNNIIMLSIYKMVDNLDSYFREEFEILSIDGAISKSTLSWLSKETEILGRLDKILDVSGGISMNFPFYSAITKSIRTMLTTLNMINSLEVSQNDYTSKETMLNLIREKYISLSHIIIAIKMSNFYDVQDIIEQSNEINALFKKINSDIET